MTIHPALVKYLHTVTSTLATEPTLRTTGPEPIELKNDFLTQNGAHATLTLYRADRNTFTFRLSVKNKNGKEVHTFVQCMGAQTCVHLDDQQGEILVVDLEKIEDLTYWGKDIRPLTRALLLPLAKLLIPDREAA